jgi:hypothetical protein
MRELQRWREGAARSSSSGSEESDRNGYEVFDYLNSADDVA